VFALEEDVLWRRCSPSPDANGTTDERRLEHLAFFSFFFE
jgi:hypothetical protein